MYLSFKAMNWHFLLALASIYLSSSISSADATKLDRKLVKNFSKLNDYLEKRVDSDELVANVEKAEEWIKEKCGLSQRLFQQSFLEAIQMFISLPKTMKSVQVCNDGWSLRLLEKCDEGLRDEKRLKTKNYPVRRIDRIIEEVAYANMRHCWWRGKWPSMEIAFKQVAYDQINEDLINKVTNNEPEANIVAAGEILESLDDQDGSYARALKLLLSLKTILAEGSCNEQGTEIMMKNDLASRGKAYMMPILETDRIHNIVHHYSAKHADLCYPIYEKNCLTLLGQLDPQTYRRIMILASAHYVSETDIAELVKEIESKQVGEDFTTPMVVKLGQNYRVNDPSVFFYKKVFKYLLAAMKQDKRLELVEKPADLTQAKIRVIYGDFVVGPCEKFNTLMGADLEVFEHNWQVTKSSRPLNIRLLRSAYNSCIHMLENQDDYIRKILALARNPTSIAVWMA